jgi:hypothetical protein
VPSSFRPPQTPDGVADAALAAIASERRRASSCHACEAPLAHDQRYCVECGQRREPMPTAIADRIAAGVGDTRSAAVGEPACGGFRGEPARSIPRFSPAALAVAVMSVLAFGVVVGTAASPAEEVTKPVLIAAASPTPGSQAAATTPSPPTIPSSEPTPTAQEAEPSSPPAAASKPPSTKPTSTKKPTKSTAPKKPSGASEEAASALPPIKHVFLIVLSNQGYNAAFGAGSSAPYLAKTLPKQGELLPDYYAVSSGELANEIALISGQGPTVQTAANCATYSAITPGTVGSEGQILGSGCVYPQQTLTVAAQLTSAGKTWKAYIGGMEDAGAGQPTTCRHPALPSADPNQLPTPGDPYVTWRNPFVYFQSITGSGACAEGDVGLERLAFDLTSARQTPSLAFIVPGRCQDGSEEPCAPGQAAGLVPADTFLESVVPEIERSPAYREGGLIAITSDQAPQSGPNADSSGCCLTVPYPNLQGAPASPATGTGATGPTDATGPTGAIGSTGSTGTTSPTEAEQTPPGGGKVGLLLISKYVKPGSVNAIGQYNHFSLLASIEDLFGLKPLGYAGAKGLLPFDKSIYNAYKRPAALSE